MMWFPAPRGILAGRLQVRPSADLEKKRSLPEQPGLNEQSGQAIITVPSAPTSALGKGPERTPPSRLKKDGAILVAGENVAPPSVDRTTEISSSKKGMTTVPSGSDTGWGAGAAGPRIPRRPALPGDPTRADHVRPPSVDVWVTRRSVSMSL
jgi:hypothetical protein